MKSGFDLLATSYDKLFTYSSIGRKQRNLVWGYLDKAKIINTDCEILEINCGTGEDAIFFAKKSATVLATDISTAMLQQLEIKVKKEALNHKIKTQLLDLNKISDETFSQKFDLIFSDFGGLNCISPENMELVLSKLINQLKPDGRCVLVIMSSFCCWETLYFIIKFKINKAFRRLSKFSVVTIEGNEVNTWYYAPNKINKLLPPNTNVVSKHPVGFFLPPSYLESFFKEKTVFLNQLFRLEQCFFNMSILSGLSDHYIIDIQKKK